MKEEDDLQSVQIMEVEFQRYVVNIPLSSTSYHFEMLFLSLARQLIGDPDLAFTTQAVTLDPALQQQYEVELQRAEAIPLTEDDKDFLA
jgi:hypothetical protein